jgi:hypothetical protein
LGLKQTWQQVQSIRAREQALHDADVAIAAGGGGNTDLSVTTIRITPTPAFEKAVRSGDLTEDDATGHRLQRGSTTPRRRWQHV